MTKERAQELLDTATKINGNDFIGFNGISETEDNYIKLIWSMMSDDKSYYDAVVMIAES